MQIDISDHIEYLVFFIVSAGYAGALQQNQIQNIGDRLIAEFFLLQMLDHQQIQQLEIELSLSLSTQNGMRTGCSEQKKVAQRHLVFVT